MVALSRTREVYSWGYGAEGQGGHGSLLHMRTPRLMSAFRDIPVAQVRGREGGGNQNSPYRGQHYVVPSWHEVYSRHFN